MASDKAKGSKKGRKIGRDTEKCAKYRADGRREENKARKAEKEVRARSRACVVKGASSGSTQSG